jgi:hypothetical protein
LLDEASQFPEYSEFSSFVSERVLPNVLRKLKANTIGNKNEA